MLTGKEKKEYQREYMKKKRSNKAGDVRPEDVRPDGPPYPTSDPNIMLPLYPQSKFLSLEQDQILQNRVVEVLKNMSPLRLAEFRALGNTFVPSGNLEDAREIV